MDAEGTEPELAADVIDLVKTFQQILDRARSRPVLQVDEETVTVGQMIEYLRRRLTLEDRPIRLKQMLRNMRIAAGAGLHVSGAARTGPLAGDYRCGRTTCSERCWLRKHSHFEQVMTEQAAVRDDWK
jgi:segregation and condensation protein A